MTYLTFKITRRTNTAQQTIAEAFWEEETQNPTLTKKYQEVYTTQVETINNTPYTVYLKNNILHEVEHLNNLADRVIPEKENWTQHYTAFRIPKASGSFREINAPDSELKEFLWITKEVFQNKLQILPHNAAFAYVKERSAKQALEKHQQNKSKWFLKLDLKDFFTSCSEAFIHQQLKQIFPFSELYKTETGEEAIIKLIEKTLLHDVLPQGTPLSPYLTNILMVPIDYMMHNLLKQYEKQHFVYTRYADDILISSKFDFDWRKIQAEVLKILQNTPLKINTDKTRYGSANGRNWNLGLMLNQQNEITIGYRKKREIKQTLLNFCLHHEKWEKADAQAFHGELAYFESIEPEYAKHILQQYADKYNGGTPIKELLRNCIQV